MAAERHGLLMPRPPSHLSLKQLWRILLTFLFFQKLPCLMLTVIICINVITFVTKKQVRFWCVICLASPWILSSRATQKQTGWWERPPGLLWRLSTTRVWTPVHFQELHLRSGDCDHGSDSRCVAPFEDLYHVCRELSHQFLGVLFQDSFPV